MLGLPDGARACLFDLDGVVTRTARVHREAWRETFDRFLRRRGVTEPFTDEDYQRFVDGRARRDGVRTFLTSRGIQLPEGQPDDPPGDGTVAAVANQKNELLLHRLGTDGVEVYEGSVRYLRAVRDAGLRTAVVTASANGATVLRAAGLTGLVDVRVDGVLAAQKQLRGKPHPDTFLAAARELAVPVPEAAVFEDALAGVEAGKAGGFGLVVGVDRVGQRAELSRHGADMVVDDLDELLDVP